MPEGVEKMKNPWHPGFYGTAGIELPNRKMYEKMRRDPDMDERLKKILFGDETDREIEADLKQTV